MSKIQKWHEVRKTHEEIVARARVWREPNGADRGPLEAVTNYGREIHAVTCNWIMARKTDLYRDLVEYSRQQLHAAAREALAECEQVRADAEMDAATEDPTP